MDPIIRHLVLSRFRSISAERVCFDNPTILVGRNGSGKSNLISAFGFLADAMASPLKSVLERAGGYSAVHQRSPGVTPSFPIRIRVDLGRMSDRVSSGFYAFEVTSLENYGFEVTREQCFVDGEHRSWFDRAGTRFTSNVTGIKPSLDAASLGLPLIGGEASFAPVLRTLAGMRVYAIEPGKLREIQEPDSGTGLRSDGSNVASVLREIERQSKSDFNRISEILATIVPNTKSVNVKRHGDSLSLEFTQEWGEERRLRFEGISMSDGTLRAIGLLAAVYQRPAPSLIAIEEPEVTIHPGVLESILELLVHASRHMQVVITTHSPELLGAKWIQARHLRLVEWNEGATRVAQTTDTAREALQSHLMVAGELLRSNALEAGPAAEEAAGLKDSDFFESFE